MVVNLPWIGSKQTNKQSRLKKQLKKRISGYNLFHANGYSFIHNQ